MELIKNFNAQAIQASLKTKVTPDAFAVEIMFGYLDITPEDTIKTAANIVAHLDAAGYNPQLMGEGIQQEGPGAVSNHSFYFSGQSVASLYLLCNKESMGDEKSEKDMEQVVRKAIKEVLPGYALKITQSHYQPTLQDKARLWLKQLSL